ncbi:MAG: hypothetical protein ACTSYL_07010 [Candidatus Thorarchaeota archaeon]
MVITKRFVVMFREIPITRQAVKSGVNPSQVVTTCRSINVGLFLSGDLRRDVEIDIVSGTTDDLNVIVFRGDKIRRVSPDERSISFFLLKATTILNELETGEQQIMDNGIVVERTGLDAMTDRWTDDTLYIAHPMGRITPMMLNKDLEGIFLYDVDDVLDAERWPNAKRLYRYRSPERFIIEVNRASDMIVCH